ncbi:hypothetical protein PPTS312_33080 [Pseudomonas putida]|uniref:Uncharacterized protein n=1 Tax=Pseudomonas putida TaxID=303 RepID=A0A7U6RDA0_PSEPU|nr:MULTISPECIES: hypothetical protein [Pseudomonas putida group]MDD2124589.1 hypothetical protein [Pseudomonas monteilii]BBU45393.1 hypothetical protein PPTS312_33080 [Pseudomonas putida]
MSNFDFQLAYTIKPHTARDDGDAALARVHIRENLGLGTVEHIETTLLGTVELKGSTLAERKLEAEKLIHEYIHKVLKQLRVLSTVKFYGCLMVNGLGPAIRFDILPK